MLNNNANGCPGEAMVKLRIPERDDWAVSGNSGLDAEGNPKWLGTNDETDLLMKANNQPMLRVGADGVVEILGQFKIAGLNSASGQPAAIGVDDNGLFGLLEPNLTPANCDETSSIGQWSYGMDKIVTYCNRTDVGIGMTEEEQPAAKLEVRGLAQVQGIKVGGAVNGQGLYENLQNSIADIRGNTVIGYQDDIGPNTANATLDVRADGTTNGATFFVSDNAGQPTFRAYNDGRTVVGKPLAQTGDIARLFLGDEHHSIRSEFGKGVTIGTFQADNALFIQQTSGNVGLGTTAPSAKLDLRFSGNAHAIAVYSGANKNFLVRADGFVWGREVNVQVENLPDYVFAQEYRLMPLADLESFVKVNHHLPEIPTAEQVAAEGLNLGEMNSLLLKKIEELTLYLIEQEKRLSHMEKLLENQNK